mmetsp:Transcript_11128/g.35303  ORF Transcript_11128/g.35303 Transcript_11128/m.35303 type:complete len:352 (+) Transcript_11128:2709-3764(+)
MVRARDGRSKKPADHLGIQPPQEGARLPRQQQSRRAGGGGGLHLDCHEHVIFIGESHLLPEGVDEHHLELRQLCAARHGDGGGRPSGRPGPPEREAISVGDSPRGELGRDYGPEACSGGARGEAPAAELEALHGGGRRPRRVDPGVHVSEAPTAAGGVASVLEPLEAAEARGGGEEDRAPRELRFVGREGALGEVQNRAPGSRHSRARPLGGVCRPNDFVDETRPSPRGGGLVSFEDGPGKSGAGRPRDSHAAPAIRDVGAEGGGGGRGGVHDGGVGTEEAAARAEGAVAVERHRDEGRSRGVHHRNTAARGCEPLGECALRDRGRSRLGQHDAPSAQVAGVVCHKFRVGD